MRHLIITVYLLAPNAVNGKNYFEYSDADQTSWPDDCTEGSKQSPIDIISGETKSVNLRVTLNGFKIGHSIQADLEYGVNRTVTTDGDVHETGFNETFILKQIHFHWGFASDQGTEHAIDGKKGALELHMVCVNDRYEKVTDAIYDVRGLLVLAVILHEGPNSGTLLGALQRVVQKVEKMTPERVTGDTLDLTQFFPEDKAIFTYKGSLTAPPCTEVVTWVILRHPVNITGNVMKIFREVEDEEGNPIGTNDRKLQKVDARNVYASSGFDILS